MIHNTLETPNANIENLKRWLSKASEDQLRAYLKKIDDGNHQVELKLFDEETNRRAIRHYESLSQGEWM